jgi:hypothetical protein
MPSDSPVESPDVPDSSAKKGRRVAIITFYSLIILFIILSAGQITLQVFAGRSAAPAPDCRAGLRDLILAVDAGRAASGTAGTNHPEEALARFRAALSPAWDGRDAIEAACKKTGSEPLERAFDTMERLRYAEENAVRRDARDLAPLRHRVDDLLTGPLAEAPR